MGAQNPEPCSLADRTDPLVRRSTIQAMAVLPSENRPVGALADGQVEGPRRPRDEGHHCRLVALTEHPEVAVAVVEGRVLDVRSTLLAHSEPIHPSRTASAA
jgi:hypothetical protein